MVVALVAIGGLSMVATVAVVALPGDVSATHAGPLLSGPLTNPDEWLVDCASSSSTPLHIDVDGGVHDGAAFKVLNRNEDCVFIGSTSVSTINGAIVVGKGNACDDGRSTSIDARIRGWGCRSGSGTTRVRVISGRQ
jgi:hypothetical protein